MRDPGRSSDRAERVPASGEPVDLGAELGLNPRPPPGEQTHPGERVRHRSTSGRG